MLTRKYVPRRWIYRYELKQKEEGGTKEKCKQREKIHVDDGTEEMCKGNEEEEMDFEAIYRDEVKIEKDGTEEMCKEEEMDDEVIYRDKEMKEIEDIYLEEREAGGEQGERSRRGRRRRYAKEEIRRQDKAGQHLQAPITRMLNIKTVTAFIAVFVVSIVIGIALSRWLDQEER